MIKGGTNLLLKSGTEGPSYDPYGYFEYTVIRNNESIMLHLGLSEYLEVNGKKVEEGEGVQETFKELTGMNVKQFVRYYENIQNTCKKCGCRDSYPMSGFPGETFNICSKCGNIVSSDMDYGAII